MAEGRAVRRGVVSEGACWEGASFDLLHRAPQRCGARILRGAAAAAGALVAARTARHEQPASRAVFRRVIRLPAALSEQPADEDAAAVPAQERACLRAGT